MNQTTKKLESPVDKDDISDVGKNEDDSSESNQSYTHNESYESQHNRNTENTFVNSGPQIEYKYPNPQNKEDICISIRGIPKNTFPSVILIPYNNL